MILVGGGFTTLGGGGTGRNSRCQIGRLTPETANHPPAFTEDTPPDQMAIQVSVGVPVRLELRAADADTDQTVIMAGIGLPAAGTLTTWPTRPALAMFEWTPTAADIGTRNLSFEAYDGFATVTRTYPSPSPLPTRRLPWPSSPSR